MPNRKNFQKELNGKQLDLFTLKNAKGAEATVTNYGAAVVSLLVADKNNKMDDVVLGFDTIDGYLQDENAAYMGCIVGRYANRITDAKFKLDGKEYQLSINLPDLQAILHGGKSNFSNRVWDVKKNTGNAIEMKIFSSDGDQGFPGNLTLNVVYTLTDENELMIDYRASTDKATHVNFTHHSYFNLAGEGNPTILNDELMINADRFAPVNEKIIANGKTEPVKDTPMDFKTPHAIGERIDADFPQIKLGGGYDHTWVINKKVENEYSLAATLYNKESGRFMEVFTTEPGMQFYTGNFLDGKYIGKKGKPYPKRSGLCLETQHFPDSPNHPQYPSTLLKPGEVYEQKTTYKFSVR